MVESRYPNIVLHDSIVSDIKLDSRTLHIRFEDQNGFWVRENDSYYRANNSSLVITLIDDDSYEINYLKYIPIMKKWVYTRHRILEFQSLRKNILTKKWSFLIVDELYNPDAILFITDVGIRDKCFLYMRAVNLIYRWDNLNYILKMY